MKRILITTTALACLGLAFAASRNGAADSVTVRIDDALHDLERVHAPIPHAALHNKALEILRGRSDESKAVAVNEDCVAVIGQSRCADVPVVAESVPLPRSDPRKEGVK